METYPSTSGTALKIHVQKGCLSNIDPGCGTNRNEALHCHINPYFANKSRIGLPLALALLTILFHQHNCRVEEKQSALPISLWHCSSNPSECRVTKTIPKSWVLLLWTLAVKPMYVNVSLSEQSAKLVDMKGVYELLENALVACMLQKCSPMFDYRMLSSVTSIFFDQNIHTNEQHETRLDQAWGMKRYRMAGDGNCCFYSVAFSLITNTHSITKIVGSFFESLPIDTSCSVEEVARQLRHLAVEEWK